MKSTIDLKLSTFRSAAFAAILIFSGPRMWGQTVCGSPCTISVTMPAGTHTPQVTPDFAQVTQNAAIKWSPDATCGFLFVALPKLPQIFAQIDNHWFNTTSGVPTGDTATNVTATAVKYTVYCANGTTKGFIDPKVIIVSGGKPTSGQKGKRKKPAAQN